MTPLKFVSPKIQETLLLLNKMGCILLYNVRTGLSIDIERPAAVEFTDLWDFINEINVSYITLLHRYISVNANGPVYFFFIFFKKMHFLYKFFFGFGFFIC